VSLGPRLQNWLLLVACLTLTAMGVILLCLGRGGRGPIGIIALFGSGTLVTVLQLAEHRRMRRSAEAVRVEVAGGVPIRAKQSLRLVAGSLCLVVGLVMTWSGPDIHPIFTWVSAFIALVGLALLVLLATKRVGGQTLTFEEEGLRFGQRWGSYLVRWTNVARVTATEYQNNPAALIWVCDAADVVASADGPDPTRARQHVERMVTRNRTWIGCDVFLLPYHFGLDSVLFTKAVASYAGDPARRDELGARGRGNRLSVG
jgi:peptidoglycan/LPS O-acetylase OafA/YrhL